MTHRRPLEITETVRLFGAACVGLQLRVAAGLKDGCERPELNDYSSVKTALRRASGKIAHHARQLDAGIEAIGGCLLRSEAERALDPIFPLTLDHLADAGFWPATRVLAGNLASIGTLLSGLTVLHSTALARSAESIAALSARQLQDTTTLQMEVNVLLGGLVIEESSKREPIASMPDAADRSERQIRHAWGGLSA